MNTAVTDSGSVEFERRKGAEFVKFQSGDAIQGLLIEARKKSIEGKEVLYFLIEERQGTQYQDRTGRILEFPQSADMANKLFPTDLGKLIRVRCTGERPMTGDRAPMKTFDVDVSRNRYPLPRVAGGEIGDSDIPF